MDFNGLVASEMQGVREISAVIVTDDYLCYKKFSRLTDNKIFEYTRDYLAANVEGQFRHIEGLTRTACEIWLKNEGLPNRESLKELYLWFLKERGIERIEAMEDLKLLKEHLQELKEESFYSQKRRALLYK